MSTPAKSTQTPLPDKPKLSKKEREQFEQILNEFHLKMSRKIVANTSLPKTVQRRILILESEARDKIRHLLDENMK